MDAATPRLWASSGTRLRRVLAWSTAATVLCLFGPPGSLQAAGAFRPCGILSRRRPQESARSASPESGDGLSEFELLQRSLYRTEFESLKHESTWLDSFRQLPFECTGCGNCCKTTGNVYMSPQEVASAAVYKNMTASEFVASYASYRLETTGEGRTRSFSAGDGDVPWVLLENREAEGGPPACVFLDRETNQCGIYSVRPVQCSTYPFWSKILESEGTWNDEVRRPDGAGPGGAGDPPHWTPDDGGCEGMQPIGGSSGSRSQGVPVDEALEQLSLYQRADRRLPRNHKRIPLRKDQN